MHNMKCSVMQLEKFGLILTFLDCSQKNDTIRGFNLCGVYNKEIN